MEQVFIFKEISNLRESAKLRTDHQMNINDLKDEMNRFLEKQNQKKRDIKSKFAQISKNCITQTRKNCKLYFLFIYLFHLFLVLFV